METESFWTGSNSSSSSSNWEKKKTRAYGGIINFVIYVYSWNNIWSTFLSCGRVYKSTAVDILQQQLPRKWKEIFPAELYIWWMHTLSPPKKKKMTSRQQNFWYAVWVCVCLFCLRHGIYSMSRQFGVQLEKPLMPFFVLSWLLVCACFFCLLLLS